MSCKVIDYALHYLEPKNIKIIPINQPPYSEKIFIEPGLWIGPIDNETVDIIYKACSPPGLNFEEPEKIGIWPYAFARELNTSFENIDPSIRLTWDHDGILNQLIQYSRVVRPTSISTEYAARVCYSSSGEIEKIIPGNTYHINQQAFLADPGINWFSSQDIERLKKFWPVPNPKNLPESFNRAVWFFVYSQRIYEFDIRSVFIVSAFESLFFSSKKKVFIAGMKWLSNRIGKTLASYSELKKMYKLRSTLVHGKGLLEEKQTAGILYKKMENSLKETILFILENPRFFATLADPDKVYQEIQQFF